MFKSSDFNAGHFLLGSTIQIVNGYTISYIIILVVLLAYKHKAYESDHHHNTVS